MMGRIAIKSSLVEHNFPLCKNSFDKCFKRLGISEEESKIKEREQRRRNKMNFSMTGFRNDNLS